MIREKLEDRVKDAKSLSDLLKMFLEKNRMVILDRIGEEIYKAFIKMPNDFILIYDTVSRENKKEFLTHFEIDKLRHVFHYLMCLPQVLEAIEPDSHISSIQMLPEIQNVVHENFDQQYQVLRVNLFKTTIENFIQRWLLSREAINYSHVVLAFTCDHPVFQSMVVLSVDEIDAIQSRKKFPHETYWINRILFHALLVPYQDWSPEFERVFNDQVSYLRWMSDNSDYPRNFIDKIRTLSQKWSTENYKHAILINKLLWLRESYSNVDWAGEEKVTQFLQFFDIVSFNQHETLISMLIRQLKSLNHDNYFHSILMAHLPSVLKKISPAAQASLIEFYKTKFSEILWTFEFIQKFLENLSPDNKVILILKLLDTTPWIGQCIRRFIRVLDCIPLKNRILILRHYGIRNIKFMDGYDDDSLRQLALQLPEEERTPLLTELGQKFLLTPIINAQDFLNKLNQLNPQDRKELFQERKHSVSIKTGDDIIVLANILLIMPEVSRLKILNFYINRNKISASAEFIALYNTLLNDDKLTFIRQVGPEKINQISATVEALENIFNNAIDIHKPLLIEMLSDETLKKMTIYRVDFEKLLKVLPEADCWIMLILRLGQVNNGNFLSDYLHHPEQHAVFLNQIQAVVLNQLEDALANLTNGFVLSTLLCFLSTEKQIEIIIKRTGELPLIIEDKCQLLLVMSRLPQQGKLTLISQLGSKFHEIMNIFPKDISADQKWQIESLLKTQLSKLILVSITERVSALQQGDDAKIFDGSKLSPIMRTMYHLNIETASYSTVRKIYQDIQAFLSQKPEEPIVETFCQDIATLIKSIFDEIDKAPQVKAQTFFDKKTTQPNAVQTQRARPFRTRG